MQPHDKAGKPVGDMSPFDSKLMEKLLEKPEVDHVRVFRLKKGDELTIHGKIHVVTKIMKGGRAIIKERKS